MSHVNLTANDALIGVEGGLQIRHLPENGVQVVSLGDVLEILRWMHADLRDIHMAFAVVARIEEQFKASDKQHAATLAELARLEANLRNVIHHNTQLEATVVRTMLDLRQYMGQLDDDNRNRLEAMEYRLANRWWKRLLRKVRGK
jgi:hypothetical protein